MSAHGTRTRYVRGCRCDACRAANREYGRGLDRRHAAIRAAVAAGDDLDTLASAVEARAAAAPDSVAGRARRAECLHLLWLIGQVRRGRGGVAFEAGPGRTRATVSERLDDLADLLDGGVPVEEASRRCGWLVASAQKAARTHRHPVERLLAVAA